MANPEAQFSAGTPHGALVGWLKTYPDAQRDALLLHGGPGLSEYLSPLGDEIAGLVNSARYQQRGLEPSATEGDVSVEGHVVDAVAVMDALGWPKSVVIGHSWGGYLALHLAVAHPERISALVILDSLGAVGDGGQADFGPALRKGLSQKDLARLEELEQIDEPTQDEQREHLDILWPQYFGDPATAPAMPQLRFAQSSGLVWESIQSHFGARTLEQSLPAVTAPTLIIHGSRSPVPLYQAQQLAALMPNAKLVVHEGKGHWAWLEEPGFVRSELADFLGG